MQEQLITFITAKLAKEKGFSAFSNALYFDKDGNDYLGISSNMEDYNDKFLKPTQSLLQTWLRDNHKIEVYALPLFKEKCGYDSFKRAGFSFEIIQAEPCQYLSWEMFSKCYEDRLDADGDRLDTIGDPDKIFNPIFQKYEDALEIGLQEALKLIK